MRRIYVVRGTSGEYSAREEWPVRAFVTEEAARPHVEVATRRAHEIDVLNTIWRRDVFDPWVREAQLWAMRKNVERARDVAEFSGRFPMTARMSSQIPRIVYWNDRPGRPEMIPEVNEFDPAAEQPADSYFVEEVDLEES